eukprot:8113876-Pyramimonas_sp.AAC.1
MGLDDPPPQLPRWPGVLQRFPTTPSFTKLKAWKNANRKRAMRNLEYPRRNPSNETCEARVANQ